MKMGWTLILSTVPIGWCGDVTRTGLHYTATSSGHPQVSTRGVLSCLSDKLAVTARYLGNLHLSQTLGQWVSCQWSDLTHHIHQAVAGASPHPKYHLAFPHSWSYDPRPTDQPTQWGRIHPVRHNRLKTGRIDDKHNNAVSSDRESNKLDSLISRVDPLDYPLDIVGREGRTRFEEFGTWGSALMWSCQS